MNEPEFSREALNKVNSPERLDILFSPTTSLGWVALISLLLMVSSVVFWSIFGVLSEKVTGVGLITNVEGIANITHGYSGRVMEIRAGVGQKVKTGDIVATLINSDLEIELTNLQSRFSANDIREQLSLEADIIALQTRLAVENSLISPYDGTIIEQKFLPGEIIHAGQALFAVEVDSQSDELIALMYVPAIDNRKIKPGMTAQMSISSIDSRTQGYLLGRVLSVSRFPVSGISINKWTGNTELTDWILALNGNSAAEVRVALIKDRGNPSGYMWSNVVGADENAITSGTIFNSTIVYRRQPPLAKAFLYISQWLRVD